MPDLINTIALWETGQHAKAITAWRRLPKVERTAVLSAADTRDRFLPLHAASLTKSWVERCKQAMTRFEDGGVEPDEITNVGIGAQTTAEALGRLGFNKEAGQLTRAARPLLKAAVSY